MQYPGIQFLAEKYYAYCNIASPISFLCKNDADY